MAAALPPGPRGNLVLASLTGVLVLADGGLAALGLLVWDGVRRGNLAGTEAATFLLLGVSATAGVGVMLLALVALARDSRGYGLARFASGLAWLRLAAVITALMAIGVLLGLPALAGALQTMGAAVVVTQAFGALIVTGAAVRRTRPA